MAYYDIFNYPLTPIEIFSFLGVKLDYEEFISHLDSLVSNQHVYKIDEFYSLRKDNNLAIRRRNGNRKAKDLINTAGKVAEFLNYVPYVKGIAISGSLSKNFAGENSD